VSTGAFVLHLIIDVAQGLLDLIGRNAGFFEALWAAGDQGLDFDGVTRFYAKDGRSLGIVVAPGDGLRCGFQRQSRRGLL
jgi:hypothetical protein